METDCGPWDPLLLAFLHRAGSGAWESLETAEKSGLPVSKVPEWVRL